MTGYGLNGLVGIVTGGGSGIGRAVAVAMGREGARVVVADVSPDGGRETVELVRETGAEAVFQEADVSDEADVKAMVEAALSAFGGLDMAFNNAGVTLPSKRVTEIALEAYERLMAVNIRGVWLCMKHEIPAMVERGGGAIVNTSSTAGLTAFAGGALYAASKHAVLGLTRGAALDYAREGLRINAVNPGAVNTPMTDSFVEQGGGDPAVLEPIAAGHPIGRLAEADEIAEAVVWLCSGRASFVTGQPFVVDGGFTAQ